MVRAQRASPPSSQYEVTTEPEYRPVGGPGVYPSQATQLFT